MFLYLACLIILLLYFLHYKIYNFWKSRGVPFEKPFFFFGNFYEMVRRRKGYSEIFTEIYNKYRNEPYVGLYIFHEPNLMIIDPEIIKQVLIKDFDKFANRPFVENEEVDPLAFHSIFSAQDENWKNVRTKISPVFTSGKLKMMVPLMEDCSKELGNYLELHSGRSRDFKDLMLRYACDIISSCAFGIKASSVKDENSEFFKFSRMLLDTNSLVRQVSLASYLYAPFLVHLFKLKFNEEKSSNYFVQAFTDTLKARKDLRIKRHDFIDLLNELKTQGQIKDFDDVKMAAQALTFFTAGQGTTATTLTATFFELAHHPEIQDKLRKEVTKKVEAFGGFNYEALKEMRYLDMIFQEIWRMYHLTFVLQRKTSKPYLFEQTGLLLEKNVNIIIPSVALQMDPQYFPNPEIFDPERFNEENKRRVSQFTFLPFGDGPRNCVGERFGKLSTKMAIAQIVKDFVIEPVPATPEKIPVDPAVPFLVPKGEIPLKITKIQL